MSNDDDERPSDFRFAIDVPVRNRWENVELLRITIEHCLAAMLIEVERREALVMITGELLENAIKYGDWSSGDSTFRLSVFGDDSSGTVTVENPVGLEDDGPRTVLEAIRWIESFSSTEEAYHAKLLELASKPRGARRGLGLVRVVHEGDCRLEAEHAERSLRVTARIRL